MNIQLKKGVFEALLIKEDNINEKNHIITSTYYCSISKL